MQQQITEYKNGYNSFKTLNDFFQRNYFKQI